MSARSKAVLPPLDGSVESAGATWVAIVLAAVALIVLTVFAAPFGASGTVVEAAAQLDQAACVAQPAGDVPRSRLTALARGFNLPGWLEVPARPPDLHVLAQLRTRGFRHVRLPIAVETLSSQFTSADEVARQVKALDAAVDALISLGFAVSIDMHSDGPFSRLHVEQPERALTIIEAVWHAVARAYDSRWPDRVFFEVLNEPAVSRDIWNEQGPQLVAAIRSEAPDHTIIYDHTDFQRIDALPAIAPVGDRNVVYAAHFYDPMIFTHQGLDWADDPLRYLHQVPFPGRLADPAVVRLLDELRYEGRPASAKLLSESLRKPWTEERIDDEISPAAAWAASQQRAVIINEFGVLSSKAEPAARARWLSAVRRAAERNCLGWAHWDYADGFGFVRREFGREVPDEAILNALLPRENR
jgi:endoglucanase